MRDISADIKGTEKGQASLQTDLKWIKGIGRFIATVLIAILTGAGAIVWRTAVLDSKVNQVDARLGKMDARLDKMDSRQDNMEQQLGQIIQRLDRVGAPKAKE